MYRKKDWYMFTILLNLTVSIMYTFDNMELKYGPLVLMLSSSLCMYSLENRAQPEVFYECIFPGSGGLLPPCSL
mgnify:CR=1 FL=1